MPPTAFHLRVWTRFYAPVERVWAMKTDPAALAEEFRPFARFAVDDPEDVARALRGEVPVEVQARILPGGVPPGIAWPLRIEAVEPGRRYRDTSENVLFSRYEHEHLFEETPDGCRYVDAVTFVPRNPAQKASAILTRRLFIHRHRVAARRLPTDPQATGVAMLRVLVEGEAAAG